jgi:hypothetical protein
MVCDHSSLVVTLVLLKIHRYEGDLDRALRALWLHLRALMRSSAAYLVCASPLSLALPLRLQTGCSAWSEARESVS